MKRISQEPRSQLPQAVHDRTAPSCGIELPKPRHFQVGKRCFATLFERLLGRCVAAVSLLFGGGVPNEPRLVDAGGHAHSKRDDVLDLADVLFELASFAWIGTTSGDE